MIKRLWTTSVLAVVVAMMFAACQASPSPSPVRIRGSKRAPRGERTR